MAGSDQEQPALPSREEEERAEDVSLQEATLRKIERALRLLGDSGKLEGQSVQDELDKLYAGARTNFKIRTDVLKMLRKNEEDKIRRRPDASDEETRKQAMQGLTELKKQAESMDGWTKDSDSWEYASQLIYLQLLFAERQPDRSRAITGLSSHVGGSASTAAPSRASPVAHPSASSWEDPSLQPWPERLTTLPEGLAPQGDDLVQRSAPPHEKQGCNTWPLRNFQAAPPQGTANGRERSGSMSSVGSIQSWRGRLSALPFGVALAFATRRTINPVLASEPPSFPIDTTPRATTPTSPACRTQ